MITTEITDLFQFIDFLEANTSKFQKFVPLAKECLDIANKMEKEDPNHSFSEKKNYDKLEQLKNEKYDILKANVIDAINGKAFKSRVWDLTNGFYELNLNRTTITELKKLATDEDVKIIVAAIQSYLKFRTETNSYFLSFERVFWELDRLLKECDIFFSGTARTKWAKLEPKARSISIGQSFTSTEIENITKALAAFNFFQIEVIEDLEYEGKTYKNVKQKNNDSILTSENWEQHKETFFTQRMATYKESYTLKEKVKLELEALEKLPIKETDHQILKDRYKESLKQKQGLPPQQLSKKKFELTDENIRQIDRVANLAFKITLDKTEQFKNHIENELKQANTINEKKNICLKHIRNSEQSIAGAEIFDHNDKNSSNYFEPSYKSSAHQVIDWLKIELEYLNNLKALPPQQNTKQKPELTINQIALKFVYSENQITRENGNAIAEKHGHKSGEKLFQRFTFYSSPANRKGKPQPCTPKKLKNKIELLESVIELLPIDKQHRIKDEVKILKNIMETEYL